MIQKTADVLMVPWFKQSILGVGYQINRNLVGADANYNFKN
jgi:hypothetical protein